MTVAANANRTHPVRVVLVWLTGNLFLGLCVTYPIGVLNTLTYYIRAVNGDDVVVPYGADGARFAVAEIVVMTAILTIAAVLFNRRQWRRFRTVRPVGSLVLLAATLVPLALPLLWFWFGPDRRL